MLNYTLTKILSTKIEVSINIHTFYAVIESLIQPEVWSATGPYNYNELVETQKNFGLQKKQYYPGIYKLMK